jgi:hypothetical protein
MRRPMTAKAARAAPMPIPAFAPMERSFCEMSEVELTTDVGAVCSEIDPDTDVVVPELTTDVEVVDLVVSIDVLVVAQPCRGTEKMVCRSDGAGAMS